MCAKCCLIAVDIEKAGDEASGLNVSGFNIAAKCRRRGLRIYPHQALHGIRAVNTIGNGVNGTVEWNGGTLEWNDGMME